MARTPNTGASGPALRDLGMPARRDLGAGLRMLKFLEPRCPSNRHAGFVGCEDLGGAWWEDCPHNPWYSDVPRFSLVPEYEEERNAAGELTGRRILLAQKRVEWTDPRPNLTQVALSERINNGAMVIPWAASWGFVYPDLHFSDETLTVDGVETYRYRLKPFCQYADCYSQSLAFTSEHGDYCSKDQAKMITADETGVRLEILHEKKKKAIWESIAV